MVYKLPISCEPLTLIQTKRAIATLENRKAPGKDQINAELLKADENLTPELLTKIKVIIHVLRYDTAWVKM
jgi:hypothetical protein